MLCELSMRCSFYIKRLQCKHLKVDALLVDRYCHGSLHPSCKIRLHEKEYGSFPLVEISPTGHRVRSFVR
jgi:hypothetical protein